MELLGGARKRRAPHCAPRVPRGPRDTYAEAAGRLSDGAVVGGACLRRGGFCVSTPGLGAPSCRVLAVGARSVSGLPVLPPADLDIDGGHCVTRCREGSRR